ncbi:MAG: class I SAM-dependent methyltransferase [Nanoarchaeota archaeon]|nr:class I SAM-dependent methyltransferase [Nanoarchaeota archaeon]
MRKTYDELAESYFASRMEGGTSWFYNENLEMPTTLKILGKVKGKKILDLGCGPGRYAKILTQRGAKVVGIDNSKVSLKIAKKESPKSKFIFGDVENLPFKKEEFDIVFSSLVLDHFEDWNSILAEVKRVLKKKGFFIFSNYNPVTENFKKINWFFRKFRVIENYFSEGIKKKFWKGKEVFHYHKTYSTTIKLLIKNGFEIIDYEDSKPTKVSKKRFPNKYKQAMNIPIFCTWKTIKK